MNPMTTEPIPNVPMRYALVTGARSRHEAEAYLPDNYRVIHENDAWYDADIGRAIHVFVVKGRDMYGWTLDGYVIPRYGSGLIGCREIDLSHPIMKEVPA